jgi:hypothetical protein
MGAGTVRKNVKILVGGLPVFFSSPVFLAFSLKGIFSVGDPVRVGRFPLSLSSYHFKL